MKHIAIGLALVGLVIAVLVAVILYEPRHETTSAEAAEQRFEFLQKNGGAPDELCAAARRVQSAYADALDSKNYQQAKLIADVNCLDADARRQIGLQ